MRELSVRYQAQVDEALERLDEGWIVPRIWRRDHTVWKKNPDEIVNRLGWLDVIDVMRDNISELEDFSRSVLGEGFEYVVLLGMGGSSLGPEVLRDIFGSPEGYPELIVLDSVDPDWIRGVRNRINLERTLFLVSSKSGTTIEPNLLYDYFRSQVEAVVGEERAGGCFVAITDPGSALGERAKAEGFLHAFENPADIGGRYSVLSYFGLVPAVLSGIDINGLLDRAGAMRQACGSEISLRDNPAVILGAAMGAMAMQGRDKMTLISSPGISRFGLWLEQLISESTGKEGTGVVPVAGEPLLSPSDYGEDRLFVYLRLEGDDNSSFDSIAGALADSGQPVMTMKMRDRYDLGAEFFRWEFAVPVTACLLGVNPFDQPDVQRSKDATLKALQVLGEAGALPQVQTGGSLGELLTRAGEGDYLAIMAYVAESYGTDRVVTDFRRRVTEKYHLATTFGYGPRFLHSTGQLHKGGPSRGIFLQLTAEHDGDIAVPGKPYTFGQLTDAQAAGDLEALRQTGRKVVHRHLSGGEAAAIEELLAYLI